MPAAIALELTFDISRFNPEKPLAYFRQVTADAFYQFIEGRILPRAVELCPVDTGALRGSAHVTPPEQDGNVILVKIGFGNASVTYAWIVHERLNVNHPVGQAKYLEAAVLEQAQQLVPTVAAIVKARMQ